MMNILPLYNTIIMGVDAFNVFDDFQAVKNIIEMQLLAMSYHSFKEKIIFMLSVNLRIDREYDAGEVRAQALKRAIGRQR